MLTDKVDESAKEAKPQTDVVSDPAKEPRPEPASSAIDTWYVLADGTHADPAEVSHGKDGVLRHKNGVHVALRENGTPLTSGVATRSNKKAADGGKASKEVRADKASGPQYKTRESKAD